MNDLDRARAISTDVLATAEALRDEVQAGIALSNLGNLATALGQFPQALAYRERAEAIRRRQHDASALPYDLANRAALLIYLGRPDDASQALDELDAGIKARIDAYVGRAHRAAFLRALAAMTMLRPADALRQLRAMPPSTGTDTPPRSWRRRLSRTQRRAWGGAPEPAGPRRRPAGHRRRRRSLANGGTGGRPRSWNRAT